VAGSQAEEVGKSGGVGSTGALPMATWAACSWDGGALVAEDGCVEQTGRR
jgi:hypothetical protein